MPLQVSFVERLEDVLEAAREFLAQDDDLFAKPRVVVPNAGTKAWLLGELARSPGAGREEASRADARDGIVANVEISFPGTIFSLLQPPRTLEPDRWSFDRLTFAVFDVLTGPDGRRLDIPFDVQSEPLLAARRIAGLFDDYHVRRPDMILQWAGATPSRAMNPTANDEQKDGEPVADLLPDQDRWQFDLWRLVSQRIAAPSPPARASLAHRAPHAPLLVAGLQSLSWPQLRCLQLLAEQCDVRALLVHPSPGLRAAWRKSGPEALAGKLRGRPLRRNRRVVGSDAASESDEPALPEGCDRLPATWLSGGRELQDLLASQAIPVIDGVSSLPPSSGSLLHRLQATVASGREARPLEHDPATDHSVAIHRCHSLSRQAEVLHDALLHAFADPESHGLEGLEPHDVVIVSPCLDQAAPHLEAAFQKTLLGPDAAGRQRKITLPLVVADRGLRETSAAVDLLSKLVALPGSRCSVDDVIEVAGHPLVRPHLGVDDDTLAMWLDLVDRTQVRWGVDCEHRRHRGLEIADPALEDVHTWKAGIEQMLLGATLPDATPRAELGGVVPLADLDPADMQPIAALVRVVDVIGELVTLSSAARPAAEWCDVIENALVGLCGEHGGHLAEPLAQLRRLREAAAGAAARPVSFGEIRALLAEWFEEKGARQPLRTGAITATSMVPMRGVPFRVVCVIGYDDGAVGIADPPKDDLVARMPLVGDVDPLVDGRRALLDCLLAARDRLVITCTGRSVKTNERVPLVTPLAELVDFAVRHGVGRGRVGDPSGIEFEHPRHHLGRRNFLEGQVQPGLTWSHDLLAAKVAAAAEQEPPTAGIRGTSDSAGGAASHALAPPAGVVAKAPSASATEKPDVDLAMLERFVRDPLEPYLRETFQISTWRDDDEPTPATLPLALESRQAQSLTMDLLTLLTTRPGEVASWKAAVLGSGRLPLGPHGRRELDEITLLAEGLRAGLAEHELDYGALAPESLGAIDLGLCRIVGRIDRVDRARRHIVVVQARPIVMDSFGRPLHAAAVRLLAARAAGVDVTQATLVSRRDTWRPGATSPTKKDPNRPMEPYQWRIVRLADDLMAPDAAKERLRQIGTLLREALADPRPAFGGVITATPAGRERAFAAHVDSPWYPTTSESIVFGPQPTFTEIFAAESPRVRFVEDFQRLIEPTYSGSPKRGYVLS